MQFGLNFFPVFSPSVKSASDYYDEVLGLCRLGDELGFEHVQTVEHYGSGYGGYCPDPTILLAAIAATTRRIRITTGAVIPAFAHPIQLAGKLAMLDNLSGGRLDVGFARAFLPDEFAWFEVPMSQSRARFTEGVEACKRLWTESNVEWKGEFYTFGPITLLPRPVQRPHPPVFVASATSPESCAAAGAAGHHLQLVHLVTTEEQVREMLSAYRNAWAGAGHPEGGARIQIKYSCYVAENGDEAFAAGRRFEREYMDQMLEAFAAWANTRSSAYPGYEKVLDQVRQYDFDANVAENKVLVGTPAQVSAQIDQVRAAFGPDLTVSLQFNPGHMDRADSERALRLFASEVMPAFTGES
ncbi:MAG: LLM class flavin-dependent oxidoreductase [Actinophytocola sp.]|uniref:LLM class flavin-dependent oxidoreductase n=1 Tax=Actinophytocola sp. TaxID=1872138 RepID=UPI003C743376